MPLAGRSRPRSPAAAAATANRPPPPPLSCRTRGPRRRSPIAPTATLPPPLSPPRVGQPRRRSPVTPVATLSPPPKPPLSRRPAAARKGDRAPTMATEENCGHRVLRRHFGLLHPSPSARLRRFPRSTPSPPAVALLSSKPIPTDFLLIGLRCCAISQDLSGLSVVHLSVLCNG